LTTEHVEHHVYFADVFQPVAVKVHEDCRTQTEHGLPVGGAASADHSSPCLTRQLHRNRTNAPGSAVNQDGLPGPEMAVGEQSLPCCQG